MYKTLTDPTADTILTMHAVIRPQSGPGKAQGVPPSHPLFRTAALLLSLSATLLRSKTCLAALRNMH